ncbi:MULTISPECIES: RHS repeat-associated core domain-containing protein [unclassified Pedobacter]|uniref:RHS repeat-associated core domain-containing protein n=1 Tax=unclassified Pedobacter TaxID=2628915 RepID=UPI001E3FD412|nr:MULTISPECIES: RHS repeat-associated core domain-containing protein [unclassified Pedobacter]
MEVLQRDDYYAFGLRKTGLAGANNNKHLYNGRELQEQLGKYDCAARFYDPEIARWTSVDPLAEKYQLLSPYAYVANNPLRFIDEDGREIVIPTMKGDLTYRNGQLYQENGKVYKGKDAFVTKTLSALQTLSKLKDPTVKSVLKTLETSKEKVSFEAGYDGGITYPEDPSAVNEGKSTGSIISLDYTVKGEDGKTVESEILVGHELSHAYDNLKGNNKGEANTKSSASKKGEIRAVKFENKIRKEEGKKERTTYGGVPIKNK